MLRKKFVTKIAVVTGANRGIGFEVCRQLGQQGLHVILTSRDEAKGQEAVDTLRREGLEISHHLLEVTDLASIAALHRFIEAKFNRLDVLVNNAGVYPDEGVSIFDVSLETMRETMEINFYGPLYLCRAFIPLMRRRNYGRVVNVSSGAGAITDMDGRTGAYKISKLALNGLTRIMAAEVRRYNIKVNTMCPGWVRTDMGGPAAPRSPVQAADTIVWLATLPDNGPTGGFFRDRKAIPW
jgi:NAD(P)-dependent dehydrogenase (short-subunit alcohol dehydrogenase family)